MKKKFETCYMCEVPETSREHVPPKCLFPEEKDLPNGTNLRKNLFSVPSCDAHNSQKSHDDEYFLYALSGNFLINEAGRNLYRTKVRRAIERNSSLLGQLASTETTVSFIDPISGNKVNSVGFELDANRFNTIVDGWLAPYIFITLKQSGDMASNIRLNFYMPQQTNPMKEIAHQRNNKTSRRLVF